MASLSSTDICNMALSHLGVSKEISSMNEQSKEAEACRRFYDVTREAVLKDHNWPFTTRYFTLQLIEENPNSEWKYSYRYPINALFIRKILSGFRVDTETTKIPYAISQDDAGFIILTDQQNAEVSYTINQTSEAFFSSDLAIAFSFRLAHYIAPRITGGDPFKLGDKALSKYNMELQKAASNAFNEETAQIKIDTESVLARY